MNIFHPLIFKVHLVWLDLGSIYLCILSIFPRLFWQTYGYCFFLCFLKGMTHRLFGRTKSLWKKVHIPILKHSKNLSIVLYFISAWYTGLFWGVWQWNQKRGESSAVTKSFHIQHTSPVFQKKVKIFLHFQ